MRCRFSTLLLSDTGEGKTFQVGLLALWWFKKTGGYIDPISKVAFGGERTLLYTGDFGGWTTVQPLINLGIIQLVDLTQFDLPFDWLDKIAQCRMPLDGTNWVTPEAAGFNIGHYAYDSGTTFAHLLMNNLSSGGAGAPVGGQPGIKFKQGDTEVANNNQAHYQIAQQSVLKAVAKSQLHTDGLVTWTFRLRRAESDTGGQLIGPQIAGSALTPEMPAWFTYCFRILKETSLAGSKVVLYWDHHLDKGSATKVLANGRVPVGANEPAAVQEPAHAPKMIEQLQLLEAEGMAAVIAACPPPAGVETL